jgi:biopolymer transport protein ExbD
MAGGGNSEDNPVALNVTAMVDIIFCLCLFFMCSFHFKQLQGRIDTWLPQEGSPGPAAPDTLLEELRVVLIHEPASGGALLRFGGRPIGVLTPPTSSAAISAREGLLAELAALLQEAAADHERLGRPKASVPVIIDALPLVPWRDVVAVMNRAKDDGLEKIQFAAPLPTPGE